MTLNYSQSNWYIKSFLKVADKTLLQRFFKQIHRLSRELGIPPHKINDYIEPIEKQTKVYVPWLLNQMSPTKMSNNHIRLPEDSERVISVLTQFNQLRNQLSSKDINQYTFRDLEQEIDKLQGNVLKSKREKKRDIKTEGVEDYKESENYKIVKVTTTEAAVLLAKNTKWCTSSPKIAKGYLPLYVIFKKESGKLVKLAQYTEDFRQIMDVLDDRFKVEDPELQELMRPEEITPKNAYIYANFIVKKECPEYEDIIKQSPQHSYKYAKYVKKGRWIEAEEIIKQDPYSSYLYAEDIIGGRWIEGEDSIKQDPEIAYIYAKNVIKGRWIEGEESIKQSKKWAFMYAKKIIKGRWPEGEDIIKKDPNWAYNYAKDTIRGRFPEAEEYIKQNPKMAFLYAFHILKGRFLEAEEYLKKYPEFAYNYAYVVMGERWPEAEPYIKTAAYWAYTYANYVIKGRFLEAEENIKNSGYSNTYANIFFPDGKWPEENNINKEEKYETI